MTRTHDTLPQKPEEHFDLLGGVKEKVRLFGVAAIKWALRRVEDSYWKPGDPITRFTVFDDNATYDLSETDGIIPNISKTPIDVIGGTMTVFAPGEEERVLRALRQEEQKQQ